MPYGDSDDTHFTILEAFPQLKDAGGYEILRASQNRILEVVPAPADGYTTAYLMDIFGQAKIYLRPIQRDLLDSTDHSPISHSVSYQLKHKPSLFTSIILGLCQHLLTSIEWTKGEMP